MDGHQPPLKTVEEMAELYLRELLAVQPEGPYLLGGMCLGGVIAYEMAQQLRARGQEIALLAPLDTRRPPGFRLSLWRQRRQLRHWVAYVATREQERYMRRVWIACEKARNRYRPKPYEGRVTLFWSNLHREQPERLEQWKKIARGGLEVIPMPTTHRGILQHPHVETLAAHLAERMKEL